MIEPPIQSGSPDIQSLKDEGRFYLRSNQVEKALMVYVRILREDPHDLMSLLILGDSYLAGGEYGCASELYQKALDLEPERTDITRRLELCRDFSGEKPLPGGKQQSLLPQSITRIIQRLTGKLSLVPESEVQRAAVLLDETLRCTSPAAMVADRLDEIDTLLPALIELNIRQAKAEGKTELVSTLETVLADMLVHTGNRPVWGGDGTPEAQPKPVSGEFIRSTRLQVAGCSSLESPHRLGLAMRALKGMGFETTIVTEDSLPDSDCRVVIAHNPHASPALMKTLAGRAAAGKAVVVDLDVDFRRLPVDHADSARFGLQNPSTARLYTAALELADLVVVPGKAAGESLLQDGYPVKVIPDGWDCANPFWQKPAPARATINLGLLAAPGQVEDATLLRRAVVRILREFPQTRLVLGGDPAVYALFDSMPDVRRLFLPPADEDDYPYLLAQMDVLMVPMLETPFNQVRSDRRLMEAGARRIPWVASPNPAHLEWSAGGLISYSMDEWYSHLRSLLQDADFRASLATDGFMKAQQREATFIASLWAEALAECLNRAGK